MLTNYSRVLSKIVSKIINKGPKRHRKWETNGKIDKFTCDVVRRVVYNRGVCPTVADIVIKLHRDCDFPYKETTLRMLLKKPGFRFRVLKKRRVIRKSHRIIAWRFR